MPVFRQRRRGLGKGNRLPKPPVVCADPHCLLAEVERHVYWLAARGYADSGLESRRRDLVTFCTWCEERGITRPPDLNRLVLDLYQKWVSRLTRKDGAPLCLHTQSLKLQAVAGFCRWLARERLVLSNPAAEMELPKSGVRLPRVVLTAEEVEKVLAVPDLSDPLGVRDRAILETLYSTGIRRAELMRLAVSDVDFRRAVMVIRQGKGRKDRFVPAGERALAWIAKYLREVRPQLATRDDDGTLFLGSDGYSFSKNYLGEMVTRTVLKADIGKRGSCHLFRHTMATLMLERGADVRFIQRILGHSSLATTEVYTHVSIHALKAVHEATHPGSRLRRRSAEEGHGLVDLADLAAALEEEDSLAEDEHEDDRRPGAGRSAEAGPGELVDR